MKVAGIIAEFNPFHNGHAYLIRHAKEVLGADRVVVVMSGSFTQRGDIAVMYKYDRVKSALKCGADAVFELPVSYSTATAEAFAFGGVSILNSLGCTDCLVFGAESDDTDRMEELVGLLIYPPAEYLKALEEGLKEGLSYPSARSRALPEYSDLVSSPNNILAIEYIKAIKRIGSDIKPVAVLRTGKGYHDTDLAEYASAEAIRAALNEVPDEVPGTNAEMVPGTNTMPGTVSECVPDAVFDIMSTAYRKTFPLSTDDLSALAEYVLLTVTSEELSEYQDMNPDLANRFLNAASACRNADKPFVLSEFISSMRTKELTYTRISRAMLHCILGLKDMTRSLTGDLIPCPYTRLLGFRSEASELMHTIAGSAAIPIINKAAGAPSLLSPEVLPLFDATIRADRLSDMIISNKYGTRVTDGCRISPVII
ncbi:MAG: nucleotidyltransferase family protein [Lachnospiraceae bacterium]|nr:nucleotidyltransferase family protein [Lachnospiraceae bacterium]